MGEGILRELAAEEGLGAEIEVRSAGTWAVNGSAASRNGIEVVAPPEDVRDDFSGISVCMHVRDYQRTTASLVTWLPADREERPRTVAALGSPCCSIFVPCGTGWMPEVLGDAATWAVVGGLADAVEASPDALAEVRMVLDPVEDRIWEQATQRPGRPPLDGGAAWSADVRSALAAAADRVGAGSGG